MTNSEIVLWFIITLLGIVCITLYISIQKIYTRCNKHFNLISDKQIRMANDVYELYRSNRNEIKTTNKIVDIHKQLIENNCTQIQLLNDMDTNQNKLIIELKKQLNDTRTVIKETSESGV